MVARLAASRRRSLLTAALVLLASAASAAAARPAQAHQQQWEPPPPQQQQQQPLKASEPSLDDGAHGSGHAADLLADLIGAEQPLLPRDIARLTSEFRRACAAGGAPRATRTLSADELVQWYGRGADRVFDQRAVEQACTAIMACQLDDSCSLADSPGGAGGDAGGAAASVTGMLRLVAALALLLEGLAGVYIPVLLRSVEGYEWWLSLLNCFSGGVFLAAGLVHLLPHCAEAQAQLGPAVGEYPLYLVLITLGYMLVLFVERVLFDVHGSAHGHGPHTGIAPPCVDCRSAEADAGGSAEGGSSADEGSGGGRARANGAASPGGGGSPRRCYNLRSRNAPAGAQAAAADSPPAAAPGAAAAAAAAELRKPLLAAGGAGADARPCSGGGHEHDSDHGHAHHEHHGHSGPHSHSHDAHQHHGHSHGHGHVAPPHHHGVVAGSGDLRQGVVLLVAMAVHTFLECMALGLMDTRREFLLLFMAIASHKLISGLALSSRFLKDGATTRQITIYVGPFVLVAPTAIAAGMFVRGVDPLVTLALSCFATGTFLYVGASEIVEEEFEGDMRSGRTDISQAFARWCKFGMLLLGVVAIALLSLFPDAHDHGEHAHGGGGGGLAGHVGHGHHGHHHHH